MKRFASFTLPLLFLAGCSGGGTGNSADDGTPAAPVAAVPAPAGQDWTQVVSKTSEGGYRMGNPDAQLKFVEYGSRLCPTCGAFGQNGMEPLENQYVKSGKVSYEFREYLVHGAPDMAPALLGRCGGAQPFFPLLEQMFINQPQFLDKMEDQQATAALQQRLASQPPTAVALGWAEYLGYIDFVKQRGIPEAKARQCLGDAAAIDDLVKLMSTGEGRQVTGTPSFFLNGKQLENAITWPQVEQALKAAGA